MSDLTGINVEKHRSLWQREVKVDLKSLMVTVAKAGVNIAFLQWDDLAENGTELLGSLGLEATTSQIAGLFIFRCLRQAIKDLINSNLDLFNLDLFKQSPDNLKELYKELDKALEVNEVIIGQDFFIYPQNLPFLKQAQRGLLQWLTPLMINPAEASSICKRLPEYFAEALFIEWQQRQDEYSVLKQELDNPFLQAKERQQTWYHYRIWLQKQIQEPIFWEAFSLKEIYIPLRGFYEENNTEDEHFSSKKVEKSSLTSVNRGENRRIVVNIEEELNQWVIDADEKDTIRLLTGSPGSGKSSFTKIFAAKQAKENNVNVLYIPLHRLHFKGSLIEEVGDFFKDGKFLTKLKNEAVTPWGFPENPIDSKDYDFRLLIIFDGLDELSKAGKIAEQTAREFIEEVRYFVQDFNNPKFRLQVLISGRDVVMQGNVSKFAKGQKLYHLLPYFLTEEEIKKHNYHELAPLSKGGLRGDQSLEIDNKQDACTTGLIKRDQRQDWWKRYGEIKNKNYQGLPEALNRENLSDITAQPLLNYLIALSYERETINFEQNTNLNEIYADLLEAVYERVYEPQGHRIIEGISQPEFINILMEIALAAWHGDGRTTTVKEIENHCETSNLKKLLDKFQKHFQENSSASITRLLTAFYFRESGNLRESEKTFEFTHKSFGEYLTAKRIVQGLNTINKKLVQREKDYTDDYDERQALITWASLCGASPMDFHIFEFVLGELKLNDIEIVRQWQQQLCHLIEYVMVRGMPMEKLNLPSFKVAMEQSIHAETALLGVLNACAWVTKEVSVIQWQTPETFGEWIGRLVGQRKDYEPIFVMDRLSYLDLHDCNLRLRDFYWTNLYAANLYAANLERANLVGANLVGASLEGANLVGANLRRANLEGAKLVRANLEGAKLVRANLEGANLEGAKLVRANLVEANLVGANLVGANLYKARNIETANLENTILEGKDIEEIINNT